MMKYDKNKLLVMDLAGPMSVPTWDNYQYAMIVVKVSKHYPTGHLLKSKDEVNNTVGEVVTRYE